MFCQIWVKGHLAPGWASWFDGLLISNEENGKAVIRGALPDQAALFGVLNRVQALNLELISVDCTRHTAESSPGHT